MKGNLTCELSSKSKLLIQIDTFMTHFGGVCSLTERSMCKKWHRLVINKQICVLTALNNLYVWVGSCIQALTRVRLNIDSPFGRVQIKRLQCPILAQRLNLVNVLLTTIVPAGTTHEKMSGYEHQIEQYCNRRTFRTRFNGANFVRLAEHTKFSSKRKLCMYTSASDTVLAESNFTVYDSSWTKLLRSGHIKSGFHIHVQSFVRKNITRFLVFGKQTYTSEAAAIGFKIFRSITHQENTWTTRNKDSTQIYTGWTCTCANFTYNNLALRQINIRLNTHTSQKKQKSNT